MSELMSLSERTEQEIKILNHIRFSETGACFAFGRSHLTISGDGSDNNYFFIKKDRIKRLICGRNQSGVICGNSSEKFAR